MEELRTKGKNTEDFISGAACESWSRFDQDITCLKDLGANTYRFSIEWSRVEPKPGKIDHDALLQYRDFIRSLKQQGIVPFVTLWHWPVPLWVRDQGGWLNTQTVEDFGRYVRMVLEVLGDEVDFWITLNEPLVYASNSYLAGIWPPQKKAPLQAFRVVRSFVKAHNIAYEIIKEANPEAQVGVSKHNNHFSAKQPWGINQLLAKLGTYLWNDWFLNKTIERSDFIGLNYYFHTSLDLRFGKKDQIVSDLGWELYPEGLEHLLKGLRKYNVPVYITEHGLADKDDKHRSWYLKESLRHVHSAMCQGVDVRGYFHWSLLDNFEWAEGFFPRFGLFEVDRATCERRARSSVAVYREIIERNGLES